MNVAAKENRCFEESELEARINTIIKQLSERNLKNLLSCARGLLKSQKLTDN